MEALDDFITLKYYFSGTSNAGASAVAQTVHNQYQCIYLILHWMLSSFDSRTKIILISGRRSVTAAKCTIWWVETIR